MIKKIILPITLMIVVLSVTGCGSFRFGHKIPGENESAAPRKRSEIVISFGSTIYEGSYNIYLNGEPHKPIKNSGGTVKYTVPDGQHVIMATWQEKYGESNDMASIRVTAHSNRVFLFVSKTTVTDNIEISLVETIDL